MDVIRTDISDIDGTYCYCSPEGAVEARSRISTVPLHAIHLIGTGDYHYVTLFFLERIDRDFSLVLLDNHPDDQPDAFGEGFLTCGSWVKAARSTVRHLKADEWNGSGSIPAGLDVYLSVDLDILSPEYARTDWDQGDYSLDRLLESIRKVKSEHGIIGVDICGGLKDPGDSELELNRKAIEAICSTVNQ